MIFHRVEEKSDRFFFKNTKAKSKDIYLLIGVCFKTNRMAEQERAE